jgi:peptide deformylase
MIRSIVKLGNPVLEARAQMVTAFDRALDDLVQDLFDSMYANQGVGLAAPQIGISLRVLVVDVSSDEQPGAKLALVNPVALDSHGRHTLKEGCLSVPGFHENITRARTVTVRGQDAQGNWFQRSADDLLARALLHEIDHLDGKLFLSHLSALKRGMIHRRIRKLIAAGSW